jgi:hypothetical protein
MTSRPPAATYPADAGVGTITPPPPPPPTPESYARIIREHPPLRLTVGVETPSGRHARWAWDEVNPANVPSQLGFSTVMPGGFERFGCTLERDSRLTYSDTEELSKITVYAADGSVRWQGQLEKVPDSGGYQQQESPEAVGMQALLEENTGAREIYVDADLTRWTGAPLERKVSLLNASVDEEDASLAPSNGLPALVAQLTGAWSRVRHSEGWYDSKGIPIGLMKLAWQLQAAGKIGDDVTTDTSFSWIAALCAEETAALGETQDISPELRAAGPTGTATLAATARRVFARVRLRYGAFPAGSDGVTYPVAFPVLALYGAHGLPLYGALGAAEAPGVLASDAIANAIGRWAPGLSFTTGANGTIEPSTFVVSNLAFTAPTTVAEMIKQATRYELPDWAVWEGPTFYINERGARGREWLARVGPAQLQQTGPQVSRLWNGVVVTYRDFMGVERTAGPIGSGMETESALLEDTDPENPLNKLGRPKWAPLSMGTTSPEGAAQVGARFLRETKTLDTSGQATLVGFVESASGITHAASEVRAGDTIRFVDAADTSPRRIVHTQYDDPSRSCTIQLDQPPDGLTAILERLSAAIQPLGFT